MIPADVYETMVRHGDSCLPFEGCGLLAGIDYEILSFWPFENEIKSDRRFFVNKRVVSATLDQINQRNENVIAIYHTHPSTAPVPSSFDLASHADQNIKMLIVSYKFTTPKAKCYDIAGKSYRECPFFIKPTS
ncbi:Mov34/MPN/PAD-1 family protein [Thalassobacillus sp. CUG 92003]|uniref:Mov34/MPN/PAD-1 family protein n=1 Tax=Thalassobacillus sp. CUG 92003 TaxID=2736641 RepID=UPI00210503F2|nr:M67 family metallopeptidase [Thalassobacillus sp. CUG 92003]